MHRRARVFCTSPTACAILYFAWATTSAFTVGAVSGEVRGRSSKKLNSDLVGAMAATIPASLEQQCID